ncbi:DNA topoisomerase 2 isoform X2 [Drosophila albomicans]|uniref:DNA topoisomerase 2 n=1 Tax=Drosophila albomicans TaxID=7291 RepID=A0A9C6SSR2_DROAB|nr:DNA topoisomerase 2 isoform X1 [Drosophila albomicans]XP_051858792.1 DNA topoisomerase 2 isoform X2 [Drosophila albomicans]XP_051858793.1 DNA topoisomerase 2 isoform X3 [Drosophila albomicans]XP_051858794.1 DNA topoisomerase 2 isoform X1 [Drosophila albomicans]XP_051858795.1 DNA topoisomerase 2 isoform X2 [Drosophila albomicans]XP_051858796.1 DNA topoisomerase 2 isoform X2 [Drosophila albomicans]
MQNGNKAMSIEQMYQKKSQLEHILLRPDSYIGSVEFTKELMWVYEAEGNRMVQREISFVPGLYKIFDEILVNAADNKQRDKSMNTIKVDIDPEKNLVSIWNNGQGIPVTMHKEQKMYVPTMIFGHLLTSSNYNDDEKKVTGGRNGYGAKLCNIFSQSFTLETATKQYKKSFKQTWGDNMGKASDPIIKDFNGTDFTRITFSPDLAKFKMEKLDEDIVALMSRRAYDVAASTKGVSVYLNGTKVGVKNFKDYIDLFVKNSEDDSQQPVKVIYENAGERWEVACCPSDRGFQQVSFVNSIATTKGGRHVDHVADSVIKQLIEVLKKKNKNGINIKPFQVRNHLWIFVNCLIENPTFDSQTKENMTLQAKSFGSKCTLSEKFIGNLAKAGIVESVLAWAKFKAQNDIAKTGGKKSYKIKGIPKLEDANEAGTKNSLNCTLILTEGDSAKSLAVSGLGVIGRNYYGVFPLRGKLLNVREASFKQLTENAEINNLCKIIGLQYKKKYLTMDDLKTLRYGKVMIMTDQDQDGSHIKGLLINFIHTNWPELLRLPFLEEFITPIVKATKKNEEISFYSLPEFEEWKMDTPNHHTYNIKYYKGLGTSTSKEAKEYFQDMERHRILFKYDGAVDDDSIMMAFAKKHVDLRKTWLTNHMDEVKRRKQLGLPERYLYTKGTKHISYADFVNLELVLFSNADNERSIPSMVDGLKPGQRKVMFTCFKRNDKREVKVAQLSGSVAEMSSYHHGEVSLQMTIVNLAQNYVGSNNINLLEPRGQFGTRLTGGKDCASARYIFTIMSPLTRLIFHPLDDPLMQYQVDDGQKIEPTWYIPIIPMVLVNGAEGIGTGWSTKIANYNPREIIENLRRMINGEPQTTMIPWYKNFKGTMESVGDNRFCHSGNIQILPDNRIEITELPVGVWTQTYKENVLEALSNGTEKVKAVISEYREYHTDTTVRFVISFNAGEFERLRAEEGGFHRVFKLCSSISLNQMHAFDENNCLRRFPSPKEIMEEFFKLRLEYYNRRKDYLVGQLTAQSDRLSDQARFILEKCEKKLVVENKQRKAMIDELIKRGYRPDPVKEWQRRIKIEDEAEPEDDGDEEEQALSSSSKAKVKKEVDPEKAFQKLTEVKKFDYLLGMSMWMLTEERKNELLKQRDNKLEELDNLIKKTPQMLWMTDLDMLHQKLDEVEEKERLEEQGINLKQSKAIKGQKAVAGKGKAKGKAAAGNEDIFPDPIGEKVAFKVTDDLLKKWQPPKERVPRVKAEKKSAGDEVDDFDALVEGGVAKTSPKAKKAAVKKEPGEKKPRQKKENGDGLKQGKLDFTKSKPKKKANVLDDDDDEEEDFETITVAPREDRPGRRAASKKIDYSFIDDDDEAANDNSKSGKDDDDFESDGSPIKRPKKRSRDDDSGSSGGKKKATQKKYRAVESDESDAEFVDDDDSDFEG